MTERVAGPQAGVIGGGGNQDRENRTSEIGIDNEDRERELDDGKADEEKSSDLKTHAGIEGQGVAVSGASCARERDARGRWVAALKPPAKSGSVRARAATAAPAEKRARAQKTDPTKEDAAKAQATVVNKLLRNMEAKLSGRDAKASLGDYFPNDGLGGTFSGMSFYDAWNAAQFLTLYGHSLGIITSNTVNPLSFPNEVAYLPTVIGNFTAAVMSYVRTTYASCRFEVLYPTDVNQTAFNKAINYPATWTPSALTVLKTESFGFTLGRNLDESLQTIDFGIPLGFTASQRSHLVGVGDVKTPWIKEVRMAAGMRFESVVLFALDQFCLIGYPAPLPESTRRSIRGGR